MDKETWITAGINRNIVECKDNIQSLKADDCRY